MLRIVKDRDYSKNILRQLNRQSGDHLLEIAQRLQRLFCRRRIDLDQRHRLAATLAAPEMKATNVDATLAENRAELSDHSGHVPTARHEHVAFRRGFEIETVDLGDASFAALFAVTEKSSGETSRRLSGCDLRADGRRDVAARAHVRGRDFDAAFVGDQKSIDDVYSRADVAQQSGNKRARYGSRININNLAGELDPHFANRLVDELGLETSETLRERNVRLQQAELFHSDRGNIYRATQCAGQQKVAHLFGNSERNAFLRFGR